MNLSIIGASQILNQYHINAINALDKINLQYIFDLNYSSSLLHKMITKNNFELVKNFKFPMFSMEDRLYKNILIK